MWSLAFAIYFACKLVTWCMADTAHVPRLRQLAYIFAWPGMNTASFFDRTRRAFPPSTAEWLAAAAKTFAGAFVFWNAQNWIAVSSPVLLGWAGMIGIVMMLHFGSFHLLSCSWRARDIEAPPLMNRPMRSTSVTEFWGRRWNTAFRDLTHQFLFRPQARQLGPARALVTGFFVSGVIHDLVISLPAGGGYGGPTAFFCIQAAAILLERSPAARSIGLGSGLRGWLFTALVLLVPARLLLHEPFVIQIVVPFMSALGAA
jgi:hypothetical protein